MINNFFKGEFKQRENFCNPKKGNGYGIKKDDGNE